MKYLSIANSIILFGILIFNSFSIDISTPKKSKTAAPNYATVLCNEIEETSNVMSVSDFGATKYDEFENDEIENSDTEPKVTITRVLDSYCLETDCEKKTAQAYEFGLKKANSICEVIYSEIICCLNGEVVIALIKIYPSVYCGEQTTASAGITIK